MSNSTQNDEILFTAWYCPKGKLGHYVCYNATQRHIDEHLAECKALPPTQNDWEKRFWEYYEGRKEKDGYINPSFLLLFIAKELADARREAYEKGYQDGFDRKPRQISDSAHEYQKKLATLREEEKDKYWFITGKELDEEDMKPED